MRGRGEGKAGIAGLVATFAAAVLLLLAAAIAVATPAGAVALPSSSIAASAAAALQPDLRADHCTDRDCADAAAGCPGGQGVPLGWIAVAPGIAEGALGTACRFAREMMPSGIDRQPALRPPR